MPGTVADARDRCTSEHDSLPERTLPQERDSANKRDIGNRTNRRAKFPQEQKGKEIERDKGNYFPVDSQGRLPGGDGNQQLWDQRHRAYLHSTA